uniref:Acetylglutamate kinase n=1 Tax=Helminthora furcellata TaxID=1884666 RepID=A0A1G4NRC4_9FLOR|nr:Acetylglutamate kinase [Helminthora furcellata]SCW21217.1 Acetylglutamate kinase [Helminthora furcellata]SCW24077.1 Acetylglutamate kinase [Helminthora furcellata]
MNYSDKLASFYEIQSILQDIRGKRVVIKYGGAAMKNHRLTERVIKNMILLREMGLQCVIVHGGGPAINDWLKKLSIQPEFHEGIRITDPETMQIVQMVLAGQVNKNLVALLNESTVKAVGLSGHDGKLITALPIDQESNNRVANVKAIDNEILDVLLSHDYIPVIAPIGVDTSGLSYNINADVVAGYIASAINADMLIMLTDTPGILLDSNDTSTLLEHVNIRKIYQLIESGIIHGGMLPKVKSCLKVIDSGVRTVKIIDGRIPDSLILSFMPEVSIGTSIVN